VLNPNEARLREHLPSYPGGDAFVNPNTTGSGPLNPATNGGNNG
jgi:hypothetical protein